MLPILQVGPVAIQTPGLIILLGIWIGLSFGEKTCKWFYLQPEDLYNIITIAILAGILGARLTFVLNNLGAFAIKPLNIFSLNLDLLDPIGGLLFGALAILIYIQRKKINGWDLLNSVTPFLAIMNISIPLANLASGNGFGAITNRPWGVNLWGAKRHPTQIYETLAGFIILIAILIIIKRNAISRYHFSIFSIFIIFIAAERLFLEKFRGDSVTILGGFRTNQLIAWIVLAIGLILYIKIPHKNESKKLKT